MPRKLTLSHRKKRTTTQAPSVPSRKRKPLGSIENTAASTTSAPTKRQRTHIANGFRELGKQHEENAEDLAADTFGKKIAGVLKSTGETETEAVAKAMFGELGMTASEGSITAQPSSPIPVTPAANRRAPLANPTEESTARTVRLLTL